MDTSPYESALAEWERRQLDELDRWEEARWKEYDAAPEGKSIDTIGDSSGAYYRSIEERVEEARQLLRKAESAEACGNSELSGKYLKEFLSRLDG